MTREKMKFTTKKLSELECEVDTTVDMLDFTIFIRANTHCTG